MRKQLALLFTLLMPFHLMAIDDIDNDFQIWLHFDASHKVNPCVTAKFMISNRYDHYGTREYYKFLQPSVEFKLTKTWSTTPAFRYAWTKKEHANGHTWWQGHSVPFVDVTKTYTYKCLTFADRNRFEWRSNVHEWLYRNRFMITVEKESLPVTPFISDEIFLNRFERLNQNRLEVGFTTPSYGYFSIRLAYMLRSKELSTGWINQNVLCFYLRGAF